MQLIPCAKALIPTFDAKEESFLVFSISIKIIDITSIKIEYIAEQNRINNTNPRTPVVTYQKHYIKEQKKLHKSTLNIG